MKTAKKVLRVDSLELVSMLADLKLSTSQDSTLPMIDGVLLHVAQHQGRAILVGTSTDRRILAQAHIDVEGDLEQTLVRTDSLTDILSVMRPFCRRTGSSWEIESDESTLVFRQGVLPGLPSVSVGFERPTADLKFITKVERLLSMAGSEPSADQVTVDARFISLLSSVARRRKESMRFQFHGVKKPALCQIGQRYRAIVMPFNEGVVADIPVFAPAGDEPLPGADAA